MRAGIFSPLRLSCASFLRQKEEATVPVLSGRPGYPPQTALPRLDLLMRLELPEQQQLEWFEELVCWFAISPPVRRLPRRQLQESRLESVSSLVLLTQYSDGRRGISVSCTSLAKIKKYKRV